MRYVPIKLDLSNALTLFHIFIFSVINSWSVCGLFEWKRNCAGFFFYRWFLYLLPLFQERRVGIPLTGLTPPHFRACSNPEYGYPMSYAVVIFFSRSFSLGEK